MISKHFELVDKTDIYERQFIKCILKAEFFIKMKQINMRVIFKFCFKKYEILISINISHFIV